MSKLLTISIPTYNRAQALDRQLMWLATEILDHEDDCEIIISDDCSTDNTEKILEKWRSVLGSRISFTYHSNEENIGEVANIASCLRKATGKFVWSLGDDDSVQNGTVSYLLSKIREHSDLSVILLNGCGRDMETNKAITERFFDSTTDRPSTNSVSEFEHFLERGMGGVLFISSAVYRTSLIKKAFLSWRDSAKNVASQAYWVAFCAARGRFIVTPSLHTEYAMGIGSPDNDPKRIFKMIFCGIPDVYLKLMRSGYSRRFCFSMILQNLKTDTSWRILFGSLKRWPIFATRGFIHYVRGIVVATWLFFVRTGGHELLEEIAGMH
ncbi:MAG TPA: glycosyltransferase family 2 protein [Chryseolinea sp.]|nr:glycosyltransferase family 2 protein [Chryseolinea sp.]